MPNVPIVNAGIKYVNGLDISTVGGVQTITMNPGAARNSSNVNDIVLSSPITINGAATGANGVDVAPLVASTMYAVYVIGDSTEYSPTAGLISLDGNSPILPGSYDMYRRVGWVLTDGSAHILKFWQYSLDQSRQYYYDVPILVLASGTATSFTGLNLSAAVPPIMTQVTCLSSYTPSVATHLAEFLPYGSTATNGILRIESGVVADQLSMIVVPVAVNTGLGIPELLYKVGSGDTLILSVVGFMDYLS